MAQTPSATEKWWAYLFAISIVGIAVVTVSLTDKNELPLTIIGALLGVAMTVFATYFLFKGQSKQQLALLEQQQQQQLSLLEEQHNIERDQEKESETFKQKLVSYNSFLDALRRYVTQPNETSKKEIIFHTMAIRMHCKDSIVESLDENIISIIKDTGDKNEIKSLVTALNKIAYIFREELYDMTTPSSSKPLDDFEKAISGSAEEPSEEQKVKDNEEEQKEDEAAVSNSRILSWDEKIDQLKSIGWNLTNGNDSFTLSSNATPVIISVYRKKGKYVVEASKENDSDFSQTLKDNFKGSRRYGTWWRELPINNYGVTEGTLLTQLPNNVRARASVIKWIDKVIAYINQ